VAFPNSGHWTVRCSLLWTGRAPKSRMFPYEWFESPNIHLLTVRDFEELAARQSWSIDRRIFISGHRQISTLPNLRAELAVFLVRK
jgi:methionine biosynthesis protein MetW